MNCLLCGGIELVAPVSLSCGHCFCWPCWWDKVYVPVIISLLRAEYAESSQNLERPTCPVGRCEVFHLSPLYQGTTMTAEETLKFGDRPVQRQEFAPALRRSGRSRRRNPRYPGYGEILNSNTFHIIIFPQKQLEHISIRRLRQIENLRNHWDLCHLQKRAHYVPSALHHRHLLLLTFWIALSMFKGLLGIVLC